MSIVVAAIVGFFIGAYAGSRYNDYREQDYLVEDRGINNRDRCKN